MKSSWFLSGSDINKLDDAPASHLKIFLIRTPEYIPTKEQYSAIKRNAARKPAMTQMTLEDMMLSERKARTHKKNTYCVIPIDRVCPEQANARGQKADERVPGQGERRVTVNDYRVSFWDDGNVLELQSVDGCTTL